METRSHKHSEFLEASPESVFELLTTPSAIREWWGASRAIVHRNQGGVWAAAWGGEDDPEYISAATLTAFDPPNRLVMKFGEYYARMGQLPFKFAQDAVTVFTIEPDGSGCTLTVEQTGFPCHPAADQFYLACETGWKNTFDSIRNFLMRAGSQ